MDKLENALDSVVPGMLAGALVGGVSNAIYKWYNTNRKWNDEFSFRPKNFDFDTTMAGCFLKLQEFRSFHPDAYDRAGWEIDSLLNLQKSLQSRAWQPSLRSVTLARKYSAASLVNLQQLHAMVRTYQPDLSPTVNSIIEKIRKQAKVHVMNIEGIYRQADKRHLSS